MSVKLRKRENSNGTTSLLLDIHHAGKRYYEFLNHLKLSNKSNPADRQLDKESLDLAKKIAIKRSHELTASDYDIITDTGKKTVVTEWMQVYVDSYKKKDKRNMQGALNKFKKYLIEANKQALTFGHLTEVIIEDFQDSLLQQCVGEGASSYFSRFKKMVKQAYRTKLIKNNPAAEVKTVQGSPREKDILTPEEIHQLAKTPCQSKVVKSAFLFSYSTGGLRWCDVRDLKWENIDLKNCQLSIRQNKTGKNLKNNINSSAIALLNKPGLPNESVFLLPSANGANKTVKAWVKRAGIQKKITWHNLRHSAGTNLIVLGEDVTTVRKILGHSSIRHTNRYLKTAEEIKSRAFDKLNFQT